MIKTILTLLLLIILCPCSLAIGTAQEISTIFTPDQSGTEAYVSWLQQNCHATLYVAIYTLTSQPVIEEYMTLAHQGVEVHLIIDAGEYAAIKVEQTAVDQLRKIGVDVTITTSPVKHALMHEKFSVVDDQYVSDGSWNYTEAANNQANNLNFTNYPDPDRVNLFMDQWQKLYNFAHYGK